MNRVFSGAEMLPHPAAPVTRNTCICSFLLQFIPVAVQGDVGINVSILAYRRKREKSQSFQAAWEAAHAAFKEKLRHGNSKLVALAAAAADAGVAAADAGAAAADCSPTGSNNSQ